jgi:hypothetical protein
MMLTEFKCLDYCLCIFCYGVLAVERSDVSPKIKPDASTRLSCVRFDVNQSKRWMRGAEQDSAGPLVGLYFIHASAGHDKIWEWDTRQ